MSEAQVSQPVASAWSELRKIDFYENALDIEGYLEGETMKKLDLLAHHSFLAKQEGFPDAEIQIWEMEVSSNIKNI